MVLNYAFTIYRNEHLPKMQFCQKKMSTKYEYEVSGENVDEDHSYDEDLEDGFLIFTRRLTFKSK